MFPCIIVDFDISVFLKGLEAIARYAGQLLAPAEGFGRGQGFFFALWAKKTLIMLLWQFFENFRSSVVPFLTFSSNLNNFEEEQYIYILK